MKDTLAPSFTFPTGATKVTSCIAIRRGGTFLGGKMAIVDEDVDSQLHM